MAGERNSHRVAAWMTPSDYAFVARLAAAEATTESGAIRKLIRYARAQIGEYQPPAQPAEHHP
jgi:hypothetical protein